LQGLVEEGLGSGNLYQKVLLNNLHVHLETSRMGGFAVLSKAEEQTELSPEATDSQ
jgi:hypothetical protein